MVFIFLFYLVLVRHLNSSPAYSRFLLTVQETLCFFSYSLQVKVRESENTATVIMSEGVVNTAVSGTTNKKLFFFSFSCLG